MTAPTPEHFGRFKILSVAGAGGMSTVYRAEDPEDGKTVAIKVLPEIFGRQDAFVERFKREARIYMSLSHESIPKVYDFGLDGGRYYLAMEWLEGLNLRDWLAEQKELPDDAAWRKMFGEICRCLDAAHARGILHRDLTEGNIIITPGGAIRITDFGLSTMVREAHFTLTGDILGTPHYSAPEQITASKNVTAAADIWSLGVLGYQLATGRRPIEGENSPAIIKKILDPGYEPDSPGRLNPGLSVRSGSVIRKCLQHDIRRRYASASEILHDLDGPPEEPVSIRAAGGRVVRSRVLKFSAVALVLIVMAGVGARVWMSRAPDDAPAVAPPPAPMTLPGSTSSGLIFDPRMLAALGSGKTVISLRGVTGGIKAGKVFLLVPRTGDLEDLVMKPAFAAHSEEMAEGGAVAVRYAAAVVDNVKVGEEEIRRLDSFLAYDLESALKNFRIRKNPTFAVILRVFQLPRMAQINKKAGRGYWVRLENEISLASAVPVVPDERFGAMRSDILRQIGGNRK